MVAPSIGGGHVPVDPGAGLVWGSDGVGDAAAVAGSVDPLAAALGFVNWSSNPDNSQTTTALTSGTIYAVSLWLPAGKACTGIALPLHTAAAGTAPTGVYAGLSTNSVMEAQSSNLHSSSELTSTGWAQLPFSATYTPSVAGLYYALILINGTFGTTQPAFLRGSNTGVFNSTLSGQSPLCGNIGTSQTVLPSNAAAVTLAASQPYVFMGVY